MDTPQPVNWKANQTAPAQPQGQTTPATATPAPTPPAATPASAVPAAVAPVTPKTPPPPAPPTAVEARTPVAESTAERTGWFVSVGCFSESSNTEIQLGIVQKLGLPGYTKQARNGAMTCVYSGPFPKVEDAEEAKKNLNHNGIPDAFVRTYN